MEKSICTIHKVKLRYMAYMTNRSCCICRRGCFDIYQTSLPTIKFIISINNSSLSSYANKFSNRSYLTNLPNLPDNLIIKSTKVISAIRIFVSLLCPCSWAVNSLVFSSKSNNRLW